MFLQYVRRVYTFYQFQEQKKDDYEKLEVGGGKDERLQEDEANKTTELVIPEDSDPESKPPKENPPPGAKRSTCSSICIALLIIFVTVALFTIAAAVLITQDKSRSSRDISNSTTIMTPASIGWHQ